jgi:hypothetical protein
MARLLPYLLLYQNRHARFALTVAIYQGTNRCSGVAAAVGTLLAVLSPRRRNMTEKRPGSVFVLMKKC